MLQLRMEVVRGDRVRLTPWLTVSWAKRVVREQGGAPSGKGGLSGQQKEDEEVKDEEVKDEVKPTLHRPTLKAAMRNAVRRQIVLWRNRNKTGKSCVNCGAVQCLEVDHKEPQFNVIAENYLERSHDPPTQVKLTTKGPKLLPEAAPFRRGWQRYHAKHAVYQWLCKSCNCKKPRRVKPRTE